jgi:hypothetical protein
MLFNALYMLYAAFGQIARLMMATGGAPSAAMPPLKLLGLPRAPAMQCAFSHPLRMDCRAQIASDFLFIFTPHVLH